LGSGYEARVWRLGGEARSDVVRGERGQMGNGQLEDGGGKIDVDETRESENILEAVVFGPPFSLFFRRQSAPLFI
jgi:hypothetical protein